METLKTSQQQRILRMFKQGEVTSADFYKAHIPRFPARIHELKKRGFDIRREYWRDHMYSYYLVEERETSDVG